MHLRHEASSGKESDGLPLVNSRFSGEASRGTTLFGGCSGNSTPYDILWGFDDASLRGSSLSSTGNLELGNKPSLDATPLTSVGCLSLRERRARRRLQGNVRGCAEARSWSSAMSSLAFSPSLGSEGQSLRAELAEGSACDSEGDSVCSQVESCLEGAAGGPQIPLAEGVIAEAEREPVERNGFETLCEGVRVCVGGLRLRQSKLQGDEQEDSSAVDCAVAYASVSSILNPVAVPLFSDTGDCPLAAVAGLKVGRPSCKVQTT